MYLIFYNPVMIVIALVAITILYGIYVTFFKDNKKK